jgi:transposase
MNRKKKVVEFEMLNPDTAGIDIGSKEHYVAVPKDRDVDPVRKFGSFTEDLHSIAKWLVKCKIKSIAMESTGVYWISLFLILEEYGFDVSLVNARHVKNVSGKKTDEADCQWIQRLHSCGLLTASYQPDLITRELRSYIRHKKNLNSSASTYILRMQKALEQMNVKLHHVITDITGKTGIEIIEAILRGQRDAKTLANIADGRIRVTKKDDIIKSLQANWRTEHLFELKQSYELYKFHLDKINECDQMVADLIKRYKIEDLKCEPPREDKAPGTVAYLNMIFGVDITKLWGVKENTAIELLSEVGVDMDKWRTNKHFVSWLGLAPNNRISGGRVISSRIQKKHNKAGQLFRMIAYAIQRSNHYLASFYRRIRAKGGPKKAIVATARKIAVIFYEMIKNKTEFNPIDLQSYEEQYRQNKIKWLEKQACKLGLLIVS